MKQKTILLREGLRTHNLYGIRIYTRPVRYPVRLIVRVLSPAGVLTATELFDNVCSQRITDIEKRNA